MSTAKLNGTMDKNSETVGAEPLDKDKLEHSKPLYMVDDNEIDGVDANDTRRRVRRKADGECKHEARSGISGRRHSSGYLTFKKTQNRACKCPSSKWPSGEKVSNVNLLLNKYFYNSAEQ